MKDDACKNTDVQIWQKNKGDCFSPSIHVTSFGGIGITVGGRVIIKSIEDWHRMGMLKLCDIKEDEQ